jgi:flagellar protein FliS
MTVNAHNQYLENRILGASPIELVEILYHAGSEAVRSARHCLRQGDIAGRSRAITRAELILAELASSVDREGGGALAGQLLDLYAYMQGRLAEANIQQREEPLQEVERLLATLHDGWRQCAAFLPAPVLEDSLPTAIAV